MPSLLIDRPELHAKITARMPRDVQAIQDNLFTRHKIRDTRDLVLATNTSAPEGRIALDYVAPDLDRMFRGRRVLVIDYSGRNHPHRDPYEPWSGSDFDRAGELAESKLTQFGPDNFIHLHRVDDKADAIAQAQAIYVAGGNTSGHTANLMGYENFDGSPIDLVAGSYSKALQYLLRLKVAYGTPYAGVSAGQMIATANGIPHIDPPAHIHIERNPFTGEMRFSMPFTGLNFLGNQGLAIQPHAELEKPTNYGDETQYHRLEQVIERNPWLVILATENNTALVVKGRTMTLVGDKDARAYMIGFGYKPVNHVISRSIQPGTISANLSFLLDTDLTIPPHQRFKR
jgi:peptidase E